MPDLDSEPGLETCAESAELFPRLNRRRIIARLWRSASVQIVEVEKRLKENSGKQVIFEDEARTLGQLAKLLKELVGIESELFRRQAERLKSGRLVQLAERSAIGIDNPPGDPDEFRAELARRFGSLQRSGASDRAAADAEHPLAGKTPR